jgi:hypothetical protein
MYGMKIKGAEHRNIILTKSTAIKGKKVSLPGYTENHSENPLWNFVLPRGTLVQ